MLERLVLTSDFTGEPAAQLALQACPARPAGGLCQQPIRSPRVLNPSRELTLTLPLRVSNERRPEPVCRARPSSGGAAGNVDHVPRQPPGPSWLQGYCDERRPVPARLRLCGLAAGHWAWPWGPLRACLREELCRAAAMASHGTDTGRDSARWGCAVHRLHGTRPGCLWRSARCSRGGGFVRRRLVAFPERADEHRSSI